MKISTIQSWFVISTSSAAGGLPLGLVITSGESANIIHKAVTVLTTMFPEGAFYGQGSPANVITDDSAAEKDGLKEYGLMLNYFVHVSFLTEYVALTRALSLKHIAHSCLRSQFFSICETKFLYMYIFYYQVIFEQPIFTFKSSFCFSIHQFSY